MQTGTTQPGSVILSSHAGWHLDSRVNVGEASRDCVDCGGQLLTFSRGFVAVVGRADRKEEYAPNHFFDSPAPSRTSRTPGLSASTDGTWLARLLSGRTLLSVPRRWHGAFTAVWPDRCASTSREAPRPPGPGGPSRREIQDLVPSSTTSARRIAQGSTAAGLGKSGENRLPGRGTYTPRSPDSAARLT